jgi:hypothetical protein
MKTSHGILALSAAALLTIATVAPSLGEEITPPPTSTAESSPNTDPTGKLLLGIDIQYVGSSPSAVQNFVAGLSPDQQQGLASSCNQILSDGSAVGNLTVLQFCHNLQAG